MMERHLAEELAQQNKERQAIAAYNAMQYIVLALREMTPLPMNEWTSNAKDGLVFARNNLLDLFSDLQPKEKRRKKEKGQVIDVNVIPDPFSLALEATQNTSRGV